MITPLQGGTGSAAAALTGNILIVDDDPMIARSLAEFLRAEGHTTDTAADGTAAIELLGAGRYNLVLTDANLPRMNGIELLRAIKRHRPDVVVILITGYGTIENAVEAIKLGAFDYLTKPVSDEEVRLSVQRALKQQQLISENSQLRQALEQRYGLDQIVGHDYKMLKIFDLIEAVADSRTTVLMTGESGTGKSLVARSLHQRSSRREKAFVEVSCGSIPESLLESELFGHVKGAFTGATGDKPGRFLAAHGGTIFLDEINSASPSFQVKLLRVLQEKQFEPVGSAKTTTVDVRIVLASNQDLAELVAAGSFRQDLYYRINVVNIHLPPLRARLGDIPLLAEDCLKRLSAELGRKVTGIAQDAQEALLRYPWPGNVRELENVMERAVVLSKRPMVHLEDLPAEVLAGAEIAPGTEAGAASGGAALGHAAAAAAGAWVPMPLERALEEPEKQILLQALAANGWNRQATAGQLAINRTTLYKKMKKYGLDRPEMELSAAF